MNIHEGKGQAEVLIVAPEFTCYSMRSDIYRLYSFYHI